MRINAARWRLHEYVRRIQPHELFLIHVNQITYHRHALIYSTAMLRATDNAFCQLKIGERARDGGAE
jgi:hypothetical protein